MARSVVGSILEEGSPKKGAYEVVLRTATDPVPSLPRSPCSNWMTVGSPEDACGVKVWMDDPHRHGGLALIGASHLSRRKRRQASGWAMGRLPPLSLICHTPPPIPRAAYDKGGTTP